MQKRSPAPLIHDPKDDLSQIPIVGVDFGTTFSMVAQANPLGLVVDKDGPIALQTIVSYTKEGLPSFGQPGPLAIHSFKRLIGQSFEDIQHLALPYVVCLEGNKIGIQTGHSILTPEEVTEDFLKHLFARTSSVLGDEVSAVITVPAYFSEKARFIVRQCALRAGWTVFRIISEPTAASFAYNIHEHDGRYAVYDWGGGTFDISLLRIEQGVVHIEALGGDMLLGGDDIDQALALALSHTPTSHILQEARCIKEAWDPTKTHSNKISQEQLEAIIQPFVDKTLTLCSQTLNDADITFNDLSGIILVGGSTKLPLLHRALAGHTLFKDLDPHEVVALGAALHGYNLQKGQGLIVIDALPLSLGIEVVGGLVDILIPRNTSIPASTSQKFTTSVDHQTWVIITLVQGERDLAQHCTKLGTLRIGPLPALPAGIPDIEVRFIVDAEGLLSVHITEKISGVSSWSFIHDVLNPENKETIVKDSAAHALTDAEHVRHQQLLTKGRLLTHKVLLFHQTHALSDHITQAQKHLQTLLSTSSSSDHLEQAIKALEDAILSISTP